MDTGDIEGQADEVYQQILGEVGMGLNSEMNAGKGKIAEKNSSNALANVSIWLLKVQNEDADLQSRLDALKGL